MSQGFAVPLNLPLPVSSGGTGLTMVAEGALLRGAPGNAITAIAPAAENYVLTMGATNPAWSEKINKAALPADAAGVTWDTIGAMVISRATSFLSTLLVTLQLSLGAGTAANPAVRMGGVETGIFQATNTLGFSEAGIRRGSVVSGVWILGPGTVPGSATASGLRSPGVSQFDDAVFITGALSLTVPLAVTSGGTGLSTYTAAGRVLYSTGATTTSALALGTARQVFQVNAGATAPEWASNIDIPGTLDVTGAATFDSTGTFGGGISATSGSFAGDLNVGTSGTGRNIVLHSSAAGSNGILRIFLSGTECGQLFPTSTSIQIAALGARDIELATNGALRGTITSSGIWILGSGSAAGNAAPGGIRAVGASQIDGSLYLNSHLYFEQDINTLGVFSDIADTDAVARTNSVFRFYRGGAQVGGITTTLTNTGFATSSDARLKHSLGRAESLDTLRALIVHDFEWKRTGERSRGLFAQEAYAIAPWVVSVGSDEMKDGHLTRPWGVDYSKLVPDLIVGFQNVDARLARLEALVT